MRMLIPLIARTVAEVVRKEHENLHNNVNTSEKQLNQTRTLGGRVPGGGAGVGSGWAVLP